MQEKREEEEVMVETVECVICNDVSAELSLSREFLMLTVGSAQRRMLSSINCESLVTIMKYAELDVRLVVTLMTR